MNLTYFLILFCNSWIIHILRETKAWPDSHGLLKQPLDWLILFSLWIFCHCSETKQRWHSRLEMWIFASISLILLRGKEEMKETLTLRAWVVWSLLLLFLCIAICCFEYEEHVCMYVIYFHGCLITNEI